METQAAQPAAAPAPTTPPSVQVPAENAPTLSPEAKAPEAPAPEKAPEPDKREIDLSNRFAALTRKERQLVERERAFKQQEKLLADYQKAKDSAKTDPMALLEAHGWTYDQLTNFVLSDRQLTPEQRLKLLEERIEGERKAKEDEAAKAEEARVQQAIDDHKASIKAFVEKDKDTFELIHAQEAFDLVYNVIEQHYYQTLEAQGEGEVLPIEKAAKAVEDWLEGRARETVLKLKKFAPKETPPAAAEPEAKTQPQAPTLTNRAVTSAPPSASPKDLSDEDSKRAAASLLRWT